MFKSYDFDSTFCNERNHNRTVTPTIETNKIKINWNFKINAYQHFIAKKLPKSEGPAAQAGQGRRLAETEQNRPTNGCCKNWCDVAILV